MKFSPDLRRGVLLKRYKRFLADVELPGKKVLTLHCPNTGAMTGCCDPGSVIWYSTSNNAKRKYPNTLEIVENFQGHKIGVNSALANRVVAEALDSGAIDALAQYSQIQREPAIPLGKGRFDFRLVDKNEVLKDCFIEVKSVSLHIGDGLGSFPDSVSERATRHVQALANSVSAGKRAVLLFCVQHSGIKRVCIAGNIDPEYQKAVEKARNMGVEVMVYTTNINTQGISLAQQLEFLG